MALATAPAPRAVLTERFNSFVGLSDPEGLVTMSAVQTNSGDQVDWSFPGFEHTNRFQRLDSEPWRLSGALYGISLDAMPMSVLNSTVDLSGTGQPMQMLSEGWPAPPPGERRLQNAVDLDRSEIGFDETAAAILGRFYDLGHATAADLAEWFQSADQWVAFSRLQRCRYIEDLGTLFTLSHDGREFVEEILAEDAAE